MRKTFCVFSLIAIVLLASAGDAFAQRGGRGGGRGFGGRGYGGGDYGGRGFYGLGFYGGYGYGWPYYYDGGYYSSPDYYATSPSYYSDSVVQAPPSDYRRSYYFDPNAATINVLVPNPDAQVWFDDNPTNQRGMERAFTTPGLQQGGTYTIKARWTENGRTVDRQRQVQVQPGQSATVNFQVNPSEALPSPRTPQ